ncbi:MAG: type I-MYXAN CRISPR-associated protein Cas6/Cmx6 [Gemmatimonadetes bacterium]|nr:type I-MYXAN CRISPR-associated protein Cas6/Cmx6 [Gemmatimonadota bacterium]
MKVHQLPPKLDILFRVIGSEVPSDHGYALYSALSRILETEEDQWIHGNPHIGLHTVRGTPLGNGRRLIGPNARLGLRLPADLLPRSLKLAGKALELDGCKLRIGVSETRALVPAATLYCRIATTKNGDDDARFDAEIGRQLVSLGIRGKVFRVPVNPRESGGRDPSRRIVRVKNKRIVGYSVLATELTGEESILLQERGLGGRRRMGCGVFVPREGTST